MIMKHNREDWRVYSRNLSNGEKRLILKSYFLIITGILLLILKIFLYLWDKSRFIISIIEALLPIQMNEINIVVAALTTFMAVTGFAIRIAVSMSQSTELWIADAEIISVKELFENKHSEQPEFSVECITKSGNTYISPCYRDEKPKVGDKVTLYADSIEPINIFGLTKGKLS